MTRSGSWTPAALTQATSTSESIESPAKTATAKSITLPPRMEGTTDAERMASSGAERRYQVVAAKLAQLETGSPGSRRASIESTSMSRNGDVPTGLANA